MRRNWQKKTIRESVRITKGVTYASSDYASEGEGDIFLTIKCFAKGGGFNPEGIKHFRGLYLPEQQIKPGELLIAKTDLTRDGDIIGSPMLAPHFEDGRNVLPSMDLSILRPISDDINTRFLFYRLMLGDARRFMWAHSAGSTVLHLEGKALPNFAFMAPEPIEQQRIAEILIKSDETIEQTQKLIRKYELIKKGLMRDLFTRGLMPDGKLRPPYSEVPNLYKETSLGPIPREWTVHTVSSVAETFIDGPFGSNLKTEHYVVDDGVRVVRLQNIQEGVYNDNDRALVSERHAKFLARHTVISGDVLIAALGEDRYPVGRACTYPVNLPPAINKADCYRLRCRSELALNSYVMHFLNTPLARKHIRRFEQGVTRHRINLGNMRRVLVPLPKIDESTNEQLLVVERLAAVAKQIEAATMLAAKLRREKLGLMNDLLKDDNRVPDKG